MYHPGKSSPVLRGAARRAEGSAEGSAEAAKYSAMEEQAGMVINNNVNK